MSTRRTRQVCNFIWDRRLFVVRLVYILYYLLNAVIFVIKSACKLLTMEREPKISPVSAKNFSQTITFKGSDTNYSVQIVAQDVTVNCSTGSHTNGCSKVKLTNVVDYAWEQRYYPGQLLAVHVSGRYFAYGIKVRNSSGKGCALVRVTTRDSGLRALIKDLSGTVQDIAFAHIYNDVILACVDEEGTLLVHSIEEKGDSLICTLLLHIVQADGFGHCAHHRVVWCPYLPEEGETLSNDADDPSKLLVLTHENKAQLMNIAMINCALGAGPMCVTELKDGYLEISEHTAPIMDCAFSPDGTAVATASMDGYVKFFQIYMHQGTEPRCLHEWQPHGGKPLSCLSFLDNHMYNADPQQQFWKFAITGCKNNTELKIWSCESWTCLQTLNFVPNPTAPSHDLLIKARLDLSAAYLLLSDINNRVMYILEMHKDKNDSNAFARSISEFLLPASFLSFGIFEASQRSFRCSNSTEEIYPCDENDDYDDGQNIVATVVRMYVVQPKRLQECQIVFQPDNCNKRNVASPLSTKQLFDALADISSEKLNENAESKSENISTTSDKVATQLTQLSNMLQGEIPKHFNDLQNLLIQPTPLNLMTPDAFSSPAKNDSDRNDSPNTNSSPTLIKMPSPLPDKINNLPINDNPVTPATLEAEILSFQRVQKDNFASGGSSPSREVQEILSLNNSNYNNHEYYEETKVPETLPVEKNDIYGQNDAYQSDSAIYTETNNHNTSLNASHTSLNASHTSLNASHTSLNASHSSLNASHSSLNAASITANVANHNVSRNAILNVDGWPTIPILKAKEVLKTEESRLTIQDCGLGSGDDIVDPLLLNHKDISSNVLSLQQWIMSLVSVVREQNGQLQQLQTELKTLKLSQDKCNVPEDLENIIAKQLDLALARSHAQQTKLFENWSNARATRDREQQEKLAANLSLNVTKQVYEKLQTIVNVEMKQTVLPVVIGTFENLKHLLQEDFSQKLANTDQMLKEHLNKFVSSKAVADSISTSVVNVLRPSMEKCYKEVISSTLLPSWERVSNNMFQQLNDTFTQGTKEYTQSLETYLDKHQRRTQDKSREVVGQMQNLTDQMRSSTEKISTTLPTELQKHMTATFMSMQEKLTIAMSEIIKEQVSIAFRNHASVIEDSVMQAVRSRAVTPSPHDTQVQLAQIQSLLSQGHINSAFQQALSASDLSLVVYICERLNPQVIFSQKPCPLQQHVLLSLIQQLSADMSNQTDLKTRYLEDALLTLDPSNPVTKEHMSTVVREVLRQLQSFIAANPTHKSVRSMRVLQMATQSLL